MKFIPLPSARAMRKTCKLPSRMTSGRRHSSLQKLCSLSIVFHAACCNGRIQSPLLISAVLTSVSGFQIAATARTSTMRAARACVITPARPTPPHWPGGTTSLVKAAARSNIHEQGMPGLGHPCQRQSVVGHRMAVMTAYLGKAMGWRVSTTVCTRAGWREEEGRGGWRGEAVE